jgi:PKD repeat protein
MKRILYSTRAAIVLLVGAVGAASASCTLKSQDPPPLSGPSEFGTSIAVSVSPDVLPLDGASQSVVTITARDVTSKPVRNLSLRAEISVDGVRADFGAISARNLVTDSSGRATLVYTAPAAPAGPAVDTNTSVAIEVTVIGSDFGNSVSPRLATIRLVPVGVVIPPGDVKADFTFAPDKPTDHQSVLFDGSLSTAPPSSPIATYAWSFGDGETASGRTTSHAFDLPGIYVVMLTVTDQHGRSTSKSQTVEVGGGDAPTAIFLTTPATITVGQNVNFNASASRPAAGRVISSYGWDFGDGETKKTSSPTTTHDYELVGTFTVTLVVTDDAGRVAVSSKEVVVTSGAPTASFTSTQTGPTLNHTMAFSSSGSAAIPGRTITSYTWDFGDFTALSTNPSPTHSFPAAGSYPVTLTVTDDAGKTGRVTVLVTVQ